MKLWFRMTNRSFGHTSSKSENSRGLLFNESWKTYGNLKISDMEELRFGTVRIHEGIAPENAFARIEYIQIEKTIQGKTYPSCFAIDAYTTSDTFNYLLQLDEEKTLFEILLGFEMFDGPFEWDKYGDDGDVCWVTKDKLKKDYFFEIAHSVEIRVSKLEI